MNGSRYILVEMPFFGRPIYTEDVLFKLQVMGLTPILAHPERIEAFQNDVDLLAGLVEKGMISQITGGSIIGEFGGRTQRLSHTLLRRGLAHIIGSDTHFPKGNRSPKLAGCVEAAGEIIGHEQARAMAIDIPKAIIDDQPVELEPPKAAKKPRRWWRFWPG
jgi:protein-tyrosine phosphatase